MHGHARDNVAAVHNGGTSRKKQKGSASILHFFRTCENESNDEASHVRKQVEDEIFIAEPQPLPQSGGFNQPLPDCCESTNESPNAANIDENPDSANHTSWINSAYNFSAA